MARMVPSQPDADTPRSERSVFEKFRDGLPDDWLVLHSRRFALPGGRESAIEQGEIDFLVLDPARGLLALEVKGGAVQCEGGKWTSTEGGRVHTIKDPGKQAQRGIYALDRWLLRQKALTRKLPEGTRRIHFGVGVVLPRTIVRGDLGPDLPRKLILDSQDLADPEASLNRLFEANGLAGPPLPQAAVEAFLDVVAPPLRLVHSLTAQLDEERAALVRLTEDQVRVLTSLEKTKRVAIEGAAGTGKTVIAAEKARRLAAQGKRVLLLCFNRPLADHLASYADGYDVNNFHGLCHDLAQRAKIKFAIPTDPKKQKHFWENEAPDILLESLAALPHERWDALIVDEGQDFRPHWWPILEEALRDPGKGTLYVFHDPNQDIYGRRPARRPARASLRPRHQLPQHRLHRAVVWQADWSHSRAESRRSRGSRSRRDRVRKRQADGRSGTAHAASPAHHGARSVRERRRAVGAKSAAELSRQASQARSGDVGAAGGAEEGRAGGVHVAASVQGVGGRVRGAV